MHKKNPLMKGRKKRGMHPTVLALLGRYDRLMRAEREVWERMRTIVDAVVRREMRAVPTTRLIWQIQIDPAELDVGIRFFIKASGPRDANGMPNEADRKRVIGWYTFVGFDIIPAITRAPGKPPGYDVVVD